MIKPLKNRSVALAFGVVLCFANAAAAKPAGKRPLQHSNNAYVPAMARNSLNQRYTIPVKDPSQCFIGGQTYSTGSQGTGQRYEDDQGNLVEKTESGYGYYGWRNDCNRSVVIREKPVFGDVNEYVVAPDKVTGLRMSCGSSIYKLEPCDDFTLSWK
jgi:hypothetical protein